MNRKNGGCIHKKVVNQKRTACGATIIQATVKWRDVDCPECLVYRPRPRKPLNVSDKVYIKKLKDQVKEENEKIKNEAQEPDMTKLRAYWNERKYD
jgi:hypothetical protein